MTRRSTIVAHEVSTIFPLMTEEEYAALVADIEANGLRESIMLHDGKIIDGRNRYRACLQLGVKARFEEWDCNGSLIDYVVSVNLHRRHLTSSQKAAVALELLSFLEGEAKARQRKHGQTAPGRRKTLNQKVDEVKSPQAAEQAARIVGSNRQYVSDAKAIKEKAPEILDKVKAGDLNIKEAKQLAEMPAKKRKRVIADVDSGKAESVRDAVSKINRQERIEKISEATKRDAPIKGEKKFAVILADPPWKYDFMSVDNWKVENHYPTLTTEEICELPLKPIFHKDAVLFLWATAPKLEDAMRVIAAWGFTYRTGAIWDKEWTGMGNYFRIQHEHLLIATRGSIPPPETDNRPASIIRVKRSTKHSAKPAQVYDIIEAMYPELGKVELFAREARHGWSVWGNEVEVTV